MTLLAAADRECHQSSGWLFLVGKCSYLRLPRVFPRTIRKHTEGNCKMYS